MTFLNSYRVVFTFRSWLHLIGVVIAFCISILKVFKSLYIYWHGVTDITRFEKHWERSSGHTLNLCQNLVKYRFKNMLLKESHLVFRGDLVEKLGKFKGSMNFVSSGSKVLKRLRWPSDQREDYMVLVPQAYYVIFLCCDCSFVLVQLCTDLN